MSKLLLYKILWPVRTCARCCQFRKSKTTPSLKACILPHNLKYRNFMKTVRAKIFAQMQSLHIFHIRRRGRIKKYQKTMEISHCELLMRPRLRI